MAKRGRPTVYTARAAAEILRRLAQGESLNAMCMEDHLPPKGTVLGWVVDNRENFADYYRRAREIQAEILSDELFNISDNGEDINRDKLMVDTRKWYLSKVLPKFADRTRVESTEYQFNPADFTREGLKRVAAGESPQHVLSTGGAREAE